MAALEDDDVGTGEAGQHWETMTLEQEKLGSIGRRLPCVIIIYLNINLENGLSSTPGCNDNLSGCIKIMT